MHVTWHMAIIMASVCLILPEIIAEVKILLRLLYNFHLSNIIFNYLQTSLLLNLALPDCFCFFEACHIEINRICWLTDKNEHGVY